MKGTAGHGKYDEHGRSGDDTPVEQVGGNGEVPGETAGVGKAIERE